MTFEHIFKDISDIHSRLFNHRAAIQGLACNFVKEFEDKRGEKDYISLLRTLEIVSDCRDRGFPWTLEHIGPNLSQLKEDTNKATQRCDKILKDSDERKDEFLSEQRVRRQKEWEEFMKGQITRSSKVDEDFINQSEALHNDYMELEEKLGEQRRKVL